MLSHCPFIAAFASEANPVAKGMWTVPMWERRMSIMRRFGKLTKERGPEMSEANVPLFVASLKLVKSSALRYARALLPPMRAGKIPAQMFLSGLRRVAAANPNKAGAVNGVAEAGPRLKRDGAREGPHCCAARVCRSRSLGRKLAAAEAKT
uniref:Uncharacterized protein n=1 Tax=Trypanosoma vivax (strain Y486) TaxID=1055687 RepID=G0UA68_TRYVY|nr:hypothetical protein, conserved in T. vivax [Trypanosoma vivax Y486]